MNSKQKLDSSREDEVVERMARVGFEILHKDKWDELQPESLLRALWLQIASDMLTRIEESIGTSKD